MFQKIAKHRANDASNDVHRPPLPIGPTGHNMPGIEKVFSQTKGGQLSMWCAVRYRLDFTFSNPFKPFNILSTQFAWNTTLDIFPIDNLNQELLSQVEVVTFWPILRSLWPPLSQQSSSALLSSSKS